MQISVATAKQTEVTVTMTKRSICRSRTSHCLIPIRVDCASADPILNNLRIVDTFLLDPQVWPIPLNRLKLDDSVEANAKYMAHTILSDSEVIGMGRTIRHFTGRLDFWTWSIWEQIYNQILPQLQSVAKEQYFNPSAFNRTRKKPKPSDAANSELQEDNADINRAPMNNGRGDLNVEKYSSSMNDAETIGNENAEGSTVKQEKNGDQKDYDARQKLSDDSNNNHLIPIKLRMSVHGVRIHDDFDWDSSVHLSPLEMAYSIGYDLNLPNETIQAIAIEIAEQIQKGRPSMGAKSPSDDESMLLDLQGDYGAPSPTVLSYATTAWTCDPKVHVNNVAHFLTQLKPRE